MVNKKGYIKTLEAVVAIILVIMVSYTLIPQHTERPPEPPLVLQDAMAFINDKIELDDSLRYDIITQKQLVEDEIELIINENKPRNYDFICAICSDTTTCIIEQGLPLEKNIYVSDVFIASSEKKQNPKIVRTWFWEKDASNPGPNECQQK